MKRKRLSKATRHFILGVIAVTLATVLVIVAVNIYDAFRDNTPTSNDPSSGSGAATKTQAEIDAETVATLGRLAVPDYVNQDFINPSRARTGLALEGLHNIVIHYTGNPGTTAKQNRNYFGKPDTLVCSHFLIGLEGEIIQCIPLDEQSAASNHRNIDTVSIEVCHPDKTGKFNEATYESLVRLTAWLCSNTSLTEADIIRHHDITGKQCPKYFVDDPKAWEQFKVDVGKKIR